MSYPLSLKHLASNSWASSIETTSSAVSCTIVVTVVSLVKSFVEITPSESSDEEHAEIMIPEVYQLPPAFFLKYAFLLGVLFLLHQKL